MKLERLHLDKFKENALKRQQMFKLNGGGVETAGGTVCGPHGPSGEVVSYDYGYDSVRTDGSTTYHNRTNVLTVCLQPGQ